MLKPVFNRETICDQLTTHLREEIRDLPDGHKLESVRTLAQRFSVSPLTVSKAMMGLAQEKLLVRRQGSGVYVAKRPENRAVGLLVNWHMTTSSAQVYARISQALQTQLEDQGYKTRLYVGYIDESQPGQNTLLSQDFLEDVRNDRLRAVAVIDVAPHEDWLGLLRQRGVPVVGTTGYYEYGVGYDRQNKVRLGLDCLLKVGRRNIAVISWQGDENMQHPARQTPLFEFISQHLQTRGITLRDHWFRANLKPTMVGAGWDDFREIWAAGKEKPDGLLITDDYLFRDAAIAICELGIRVPDELVVVTHANKGSDIFAPFPAWLLQLDPDEYAQAMGEMLLKRINNEPIPEPQVNIRITLVHDKGAHAAGRKARPRVASLVIGH